jgi:hypothetical protein
VAVTRTSLFEVPTKEEMALYDEAIELVVEAER